MSRQQPRSTRPYSRVPYTTLSRSQTGQRDVDDEQGGGEEGDLATEQPEPAVDVAVEGVEEAVDDADVVHVSGPARMRKRRPRRRTWQAFASRKPWRDRLRVRDQARRPAHPWRSEEHTSELQSLMRISYAVFCLIKKNITPVPTTPVA